VLDLAIGGIPSDNVLLAAANSVRISYAMQEVMAEFMGKGEIDPAGRGKGIVVDDAPSGLAGGSVEQSAVETRQVRTFCHRDGVAGKSLCAIFSGNTYYVDGKMVWTEDKI
jgi:hypothetical protein